MSLLLLLGKQSKKKYHDAVKSIFCFKALIFALSAFNKKKEGLRVWKPVITGYVQGEDESLVDLILVSPGSH